MLYVTQLLKRKSNQEVVMFLGLDDDWKTHLLTKELKEEITDNVYQSKELDGFTKDGEYPFLDNLGFFGYTTKELLLTQYTEQQLSDFINQYQEI